MSLCFDMTSMNASELEDGNAVAANKCSGEGAFAVAGTTRVQIESRGVELGQINLVGQR